MTAFRVWAPTAQSVTLRLGGAPDEPAEPAEQEMSSHDGGWWRRDVPDAEAGTDYSYRIDGGEPRPDPRSMWQPHGVHGPSRLVDHEVFAWTDSTWRGVPLAGSVLYELHVGTFTLEGTFDAAIDRLDHLVALGVDALELMPCNAYAGRHGWGYDGVDLFAVHEPYGGPDGLKRFVNACHARGIGVVMDVVYNHLGPAGNYLSEFGPYFTDTHVTPWGQAVNLDAPGSDEVRAFLIDNARMWLRDYHCDGLRLDAVHSLVDGRATHLLEELAVAVDALAAQERRPLFLIAESELNDPSLVRPRDAGGFGLTGQWCDDVHHALHATVTGERQGYYADFGSLPVLAKALTGAYVHDGTWSSFRGRTHGRPVGDTPAYRFTAYLQNHDQVGNRATGDRPTSTVSDGLLRVAAALLLTSAFTPMLWMGEEWAAATPWQFFTDHDPELGTLVRNGRRAEFDTHGWGADDVPDPQDAATVAASRLDWSELERAPHHSMLAWYRALIGLRRQWPDLTDPLLASVQVTYDEQARWFVVRRGRLVIACNLAADRQPVPLPGMPMAEVLASAPGFVFRAGVVETDGESVVILELA